MSAIRVAIADDHKLFCSGIRMLIDSQDDLEFAGAAYGGQQIIELAREQRPDVILMDIRMPELDGITATERILAEARGRSAGQRPRLIILTTHEREVAALRAIAAGASGFLMKDATPEFLLAAIRTVHDGQSVIAPTSTLALIKDVVPVAARPADETVIAPLSAREKEMFLLAARGLSNAEIAASAYISETTVKSHISSIFGKLNLESRLQIVAFAYKHRLVR